MITENKPWVVKVTNHVRIPSLVEEAGRFATPERAEAEVHQIIANLQDGAPVVYTKVKKNNRTWTLVVNTSLRYTAFTVSIEKDHKV